MSSCALDPEMLLLGKPMLRFSSNDGWFSSKEMPATIQVVINEFDGGYTAHVWMHIGRGKGAFLRPFTEHRPAKTAAEAIEAVNRMLRNIRDALKEGP